MPMTNGPLDPISFSSQAVTSSRVMPFLRRMREPDWTIATQMRASCPSSFFSPDQSTAMHFTLSIGAPYRFLVLQSHMTAQRVGRY